MSLRRFAKLLRVTHSAVTKAVATGRLKASVARDAKGRAHITDATLAKREWRENAAKAKRPARGSAGQTLVQAQIAQVEARTRAVNLATDTKAARLVPADVFRQRWSGVVVRSRDHLLALPARAKQRIPHLTTADIRVLDGLVREALTELADSLKEGA